MKKRGKPTPPAVWLGGVDCGLGDTAPNTPASEPARTNQYKSRQPNSVVTFNHNIHTGLSALIAMPDDRLQTARETIDSEFERTVMCAC